MFTDMNQESKVINTSDVNQHVKNLNLNGYTIIKNKNYIVEKIKQDMELLLFGLCRDTRFEFDLGNFDLHKKSLEIGMADRPFMGKFYDTARSLLSTFEVASDDLINSIAKEYMKSNNLLLQINDQIMRIDLPSESQKYLGDDNKSESKEITLLLPWHQDYPYNQGSKKSITIYVPLQSGNIEKGGTLEVALKSHLDGMVEHTFAQEKSKMGSKEIKGISYKVPNHIVDNFDTKILCLDYSDILIFDMDLIHRSVPNKSGKTRFNLQVRLSDLNDHDYCKRYSTIKTKYYLNLSKNEQSLIKGI